MLRGGPDSRQVSHKIYGIPQTINSANYVYFKAYQELFALRSGVGVDEDTEASQKRLIPFKELDRIVTGMSPQHLAHLPSSIYAPNHQLNSCLCIVDKASSSYGVTRCSVRRKKSMSPW